MTLTDRFIRRGCDLSPLLSKGLVNELTKRLAGASDQSISSQSVHVIVNLLSALCRGSSSAANVSVVHPLFTNYFNYNADNFTF